MNKKIQLTPAILEGQAKELENIESDLNSLFSGVSSELKSLNKNWSPNLSNNFSGKITSAQKTFSNLCTDLRNGAVAARTSATTFASVDSQLAKVYGGTTESQKVLSEIYDTAKEEIWESIKQYLKDTYNIDVDNITDVLELLSTDPDKLPDSIKDLIKKYLKSNGYENVINSCDTMNDLLKNLQNGNFEEAKNDFMTLINDYLKPLAEDTLDGTITFQTVINTIDNFITNTQSYFEDPTWRNGAKLIWSVSGEALMEALTDFGYNFVTKIPIFGEITTDVLDDFGGGRQGLTNLFNDTIEKIMGKDFVEYYESNGGYFNGVYNGMCDIANYIKNSGVIEGGKAIIKGTAEGIAEAASGVVDYFADAGKEVVDFYKGFGFEESTKALLEPLADATEKYITNNSKSIFMSLFE